MDTPHVQQIERKVKILPPAPDTRMDIRMEDDMRWYWDFRNNGTRHTRDVNVEKR